jgi:hypothetical protein
LIFFEKQFLIFNSMHMFSKKAKITRYLSISLAIARLWISITPDAICLIASKASNGAALTRVTSLEKSHPFF